MAGTCCSGGCMDDVMLWAAVLSDQEIYYMTTVRPVKPRHVSVGPAVPEGRDTLNRGHLLPKK